MQTGLGPALGPHIFAALTLPHSYPHVQARRPRHRGAKKLAQGRLANPLTEPVFDCPPTKASALMPPGPSGATEGY